METIALNWLAQAKLQLSCGISFTAEQMKGIIFGLRVEALLGKCSTILTVEEGETDDVIKNITFYFDKVKCGEVLQEDQVLHANSLLAIKELECNVILASAEAADDARPVIFASGIWTRTGGNNFITVAGILNTDKVFVQLTDLNSIEAITKAEANAASTRIDLTFSGIPANTTTKAQYLVIR